MERDREKEGREKHKTHKIIHKSGSQVHTVYHTLVQEISDTSISL